MKELTEEKIKEVVDWLNTWDEIKNTVIPMRFKESFGKQLMLGGVSCQRGQLVCPECGSYNIKTAIYTEYKECNKCFHYWAK